MYPTPEIPFSQVLTALQDIDQPLSARYLYRLSDIEGDELEQLRLAWPHLPLRRRQAIMEDIEELGESDYMLSFYEVSKLALEDVDPGVRSSGVRSLWDYEETRLLPVFLNMLKTDPDVEVRSAVARGLGRFVYAGEVETIPERALRQVEEALLDVMHGNDAVSVRRSALEALGFSSRKEVSGMILEAYNSGDKDWMVSAIFAMGRSADKTWQPHILEMLNHSLPALRSEAARAAGELEIRAATPRLLDLVDDSDEDTRTASIWSLSQIGSEGVRDVLERLYAAAEDDEEIEFLESALENLAFNEGLQFMPLFDLDEEDLADEEDDYYDLIEDRLDEELEYYEDLDDEDDDSDGDEEQYT